MSENKITVESHVFSDGKIGITFTSNGGKFGTDELLDEFELSAENLLDILQANDDKTSNETALNIDLVRQRSLLDTYNNERYANDKAAKEIKAFCECVMHPESDLHKDADEWIRERLK